MKETLYTKRIGDVPIPRFYKLHQVFERDGMDDPYDAIVASCHERGVADSVKPGMKIAVAVGSREYSAMPRVVKATVDVLKQYGAEPFVIPAMGSHGGMTADGQRGVLEHLGVTEASVGAPILSQMETVCIGISENGLEVHMDKLAYEADYVIPINRIKAHTDFRGRYESGLVKMLAIGVGKQHGANVCHAQGFSKMSENVYQFGKKMIETGKVLFGVAVIENEQHQICKALAIPGDKILEEEPDLLIYAKSRMPRLPFKEADLLFVDEIGKDFSGTGMDTNVIGRSAVLGNSEPFFERIVIFDLTEKSSGNGNGMGLADISTRKFIDKVNFDDTYVNGITASLPDPGRMPIIVPTEYNAFCYGIKASTRHGEAPIKIVHIKNTMSVNEMFISEGLAKDVVNSDTLWVDEEAYIPAFDEDGMMLGYKNMNLQCETSKK